MALLRNLEQSLSGLVEGTVGRVFRTEVRPTEIARKLAREMELNKRVSLSRTYAPTDYIVYLSPEDRARYAGVEPSIADELGAYLLEHARRERLVLVRRPLVEFRTDQRLRLGEFGIEASTAPISAEEAPPRAEPAPAPAPAALAEPTQRYVEPEPAYQEEPEPAYADEPEYAAAGGFFDVEADAPAPPQAPQPAPVESHPDDDWLDPVDDWDVDAPAAIPPMPAIPAPPVAPMPAPPMPPAAAAAPTPWVDPTLRAQPAAIPTPPPPAPVPAPPQAPTLILFVDGARQELYGDHVVIGRSRSAGVVVSDPSVSRQHLELRRDNQGWYAVDLGSTNGSRVDGQPLTAPRRVARGSRLEVGHAPAAIEVG